MAPRNKRNRFQPQQARPTPVAAPQQAAEVKATATAPSPASAPKAQPAPQTLSARLNALLQSLRQTFESQSKHANNSANRTNLITAGLGIAAIGTIVGAMWLASKTAGGFKQLGQLMAQPFIAAYEALSTKFGKHSSEPLFPHSPTSTANGKAATPIYREMPSAYYYSDIGYHSAVSSHDDTPVPSDDEAGKQFWNGLT